MIVRQPWDACRTLVTRLSRSTDSARHASAQQAGDGDPQWLSRAAYPFASRYVTLQGQRVHYIDEGHGPTLLFLHGNPTWSFLYRRIIDDLRKSHRCIALDYPGFGLSSVSDDFELTPAAHARIVQAFVQSLELPKFSIVAHDWGGPIGIACALAMPERVAGLVLFNTFCWPAQGDTHFERFSRLMGGTVGQLLITRLNLLVRMMMSRMGSHSRVSREARRAYAGPFATHRSRRAVAKFAREILDSREFLDGLARGVGALAALPVLILWAERDVAFKTRHRLRLQASFPNHTTVLLPHAGHFPQEDCPEAIAPIIDEWMRSRIQGDRAQPWWRSHTAQLGPAAGPWTS